MSRQPSKQVYQKPGSRESPEEQQQKPPKTKQNMRVLITSASGFIGQALTTTLLSSPSITHLTLTDIVEPTLPPIPNSTRETPTRCIQADLTSPQACSALLTPDLDVVYLLHGLMSGAAEADLELGLKVNIDSTRLILDVLRRVNVKGVKVVYASSTAVFGPSQPGEVVTEAGTVPSPGSSYGAQKAMCELLLNDYSRRGLLDGRILRFPTIIVRPGMPSGAASSFCSGMFREPFKGERCQLPVGRELEVWVCATKTVVRNLIIAKDVPTERFGIGSRVVNLPGVTVTVGEMLEALREVGGEEAVALVDEKRDENVAKIVNTWPARFDTRRAEELGFVGDEGLVKAVKDYAREYGMKQDRDCF